MQTVDKLRMALLLREPASSTYTRYACGGQNPWRLALLASKRFAFAGFHKVTSKSLPGLLKSPDFTDCLNSPSGKNNLSGKLKAYSLSL